MADSININSADVAKYQKMISSVKKDAGDIDNLFDDTNKKIRAIIGNLEKEVNALKDIGAYQLAEKARQTQIIEKEEVRRANLEKFIKAKIKNKKITEDEIKDLREAFALDSQRLRAVTEYNDKLDKINSKHEKGIEYLRAQGKVLTANSKEFIKNHFTLKDTEGLATAGIATKGAAAVRGVAEVASNPGMVLTEIGGVWGEIAKIIIDIVDKVRRLGSQLQASSGATGEFGKGIEHYKGLVENLSMSFKDSGFQMGMTTDEIIDGVSALNKVGLKTADLLSEGGELTEGFRNIQAFSLATGQDLSTTGSQFADFIKNMRMGKSQLATAYLGVYNTAKSFARDFSTTMSEVISSIVSVADTFAGLGVTIEGTNALMYSMDVALKNTKVPFSDINKALSQLSGVGHASSGWLAFMGKMGGGATGGFAEAMGSAQQRGPGWLLPTMSGKPLNTQAQMQMLMNTLNKSTEGMAGANKQMMIENIGQQGFGLDPATVEILQKTMNGTWSMSKGFDKLKDLQAKAAAENMSNKGLLDILKSFLEKMIAYPIIGIYKLLSGSFLGNSSSRAESAQMEAAKSGTFSAVNSVQKETWDSKNVNKKDMGFILNMTNHGGMTKKEFDKVFQDMKGEAWKEFVAWATRNHQKVSQ